MFIPEKYIKIVSNKLKVCLYDSSISGSKLAELDTIEILQLLIIWQKHYSDKIQQAISNVESGLWEIEVDWLPF